MTRNMIHLNYNYSYSASSAMINYTTELFKLIRSVIGAKLCNFTVKSDIFLTGLAGNMRIPWGEESAFRGRSQHLECVLDLHGINRNKLHTLLPQFQSLWWYAKDLWYHFITLSYNKLFSVNERFSHFFVPAGIRHTVTTRLADLNPTMWSGQTFKKKYRSWHPFLVKIAREPMLFEGDLYC